MTSKLLYLLLFWCGVALAQQDTLLSGRVLLYNEPLPGAFVLNKQTGKEVKTDAKGSYSIAVKPGQKLVVISNAAEAREFYISAASFKNMPYELAVEIKSEQLEEVVINKNLTAETLGIVPKGQKQYTAAEKKVLHFQGAQKGLTGVLNWLRGKKYLLEIEEKYAGKRVMIETLQGMFTDAEVEQVLHIPQEYIEAFWFYAAENDKLQQTLAGGNKGAAKMLVPDIALRYLENLTQNENTNTTATPAVPATGSTGTPAPPGQSGGR